MSQATAPSTGPGTTSQALWREQALWFELDGDSLLAILSLPQGVIKPREALLMVVGGPQYRAGSHRQYAQLARSLAASGVVVMRFDVRGMGDSSGAARAFTELDDDIASACLALRAACPDVERLSLLGLCDGASAALMFLRNRPDVPVGGVVLINPWVRHEQTLAATQVRHYYAQRLLQWRFWRQVLAGGLSLKAIREFLSTVLTTLQARLRRIQPDDAPADFREQMRQGLRDFDGDVLLILSSNDFVAREFQSLCAAHQGWQEIMRRRRTQCIEMAGADHTHSHAGDASRLHAYLLTFLHLSRH